MYTTQYSNYYIVILSIRSTVFMSRYTYAVTRVLLLNCPGSDRFIIYTGSYPNSVRIIVNPIPPLFSLRTGRAQVGEIQAVVYETQRYKKPCAFFGEKGLFVIWAIGIMMIIIVI